VLARLLAADGPLASSIDAARVGASGLSLGALTTLLATYDARWREPAIRAALPIAPPYSCALTPPLLPHRRASPCSSCTARATSWSRTASNGARVFRHARGPRHLVLVDDGSHLGFVGFATALPPRCTTTARAARRCCRRSVTT
jgi:hypothetical protein